MTNASMPQLRNPVLERLRAGEVALTLMIRHARTVDIALAVLGFFGLRRQACRRGRGLAGPRTIEPLGPGGRRGVHFTALRMCSSTSFALAGIGVPGP